MQARRKDDVEILPVPNGSSEVSAPALPVLRRSTDQTVAESQRRANYRHLTDEDKRILGIV
jgi:hypothetical protein